MVASNMPANVQNKNHISTLKYEHVVYQYTASSPAFASVRSFEQKLRPCHAEQWHKPKEAVQKDLTATSRYSMETQCAVTVFGVIQSALTLISAQSSCGCVALMFCGSEWWECTALHVSHSTCRSSHRTLTKHASGSSTATAAWPLRAAGPTGFFPFFFCKACCCGGHSC